MVIDAVLERLACQLNSAMAMLEAMRIKVILYIVSLVYVYNWIQTGTVAQFSQVCF